MKHFTTLLILPAVALLLGGCMRQKSDAISTFVIDETIKTADVTFRLTLDDMPEESAEVYAVLGTTVHWPDKLGDNDIRPLQDTIIARLFGQECIGKGIDKSILRFIDSPAALGFEDGIKAFERVDSVPDDDDLTSIPLFMERHARIVDLNTNYVTYQLTEEGYLGGPHGMVSNYYFTYDLRRGKLLTYNDIFEPNHDGEILEQIHDAVARAHGTNAAGLAKLGFYEIAYPGNLYFEGGQLMTNFNVYEIAPYVVGGTNTEVWGLVPFYTQEVKDMIGIDY